MVTHPNHLRDHAGFGRQTPLQSSTSGRPGHNTTCFDIRVDDSWVYDRMVWDVVRFHNVYEAGDPQVRKRFESHQRKPG